MVKVSIIIPIHNAETYLHKCMDSALNQTLEEIEIIPVDDCSEDRSRDIIADYREKYPSKVFPIYLKENIRQGGARNRGMEIAKGEYIAFLDSDDTIEPDTCQALYDAAAGADMAGADYYIDQGKSTRLRIVDYGDGAKDMAERRVRAIQDSGYFWSRIYRADFLRCNDLKFPENTFYEDAYFNFMSLLYASSLVKAEGAFYHYIQNPQSTVHKRNTPRQYERIAIPSLIITECRRRGIYNTYKDLIDYKYISMQMSNILYTCLGQFDAPDAERLSQIRDAILRECPDYKKNPYFPTALWQQRYYLKLTMRSPQKAIARYRKNALVERWAVIRKKLGVN